MVEHYIRSSRGSERVEKIVSSPPHPSFFPATAKPWDENHTQCNLALLRFPQSLELQRRLAISKTRRKMRKYLWLILSYLSSQKEPKNDAGRLSAIRTKEFH